MTESSEHQLPISIANWVAYGEGLPKLSSSEVRLISDTRFVDHFANADWPYKFLNAIPSQRHIGPVAAVYLRMDLHISTLKSDLWKSDNSLYHGGTIIDEIAALSSLAMGVRFWGGPVSRSFELEGDPLGRPLEIEFAPPRLLGADPNGQLVLPELVAAVNRADLKQLEILGTTPSLGGSDAIALVRSARLYQEATWLCESVPEFSWLMFVSAIEVAAGKWQSRSGSPSDRLQQSRPELAKLLLDVGGDSHLRQVAQLIEPSLGATKKFVEFILEFSDKRLIGKETEKSLRQIYNYRSKALHGGIPFPAPMCSAPHWFSEEQVLSTRPIGLASSVNGGVWTAADLPMNLHGFHMFVRSSLLNWWRSLAKIERLDNSVDD